LVAGEAVKADPFTHARHALISDLILGIKVVEVGQENQILQADGIRKGQAAERQECEKSAKGR
jgi:hypothetical protein